MTEEQKKLLVVAIDFGTTYSGYAFSWSHEYEQDPLKISANTAWHSSSGQSMMSLKTPTTVLLNPDQTFHSFGFDAEDNYLELAEEGKHMEWYYFRRFKMLLFNKLVVNRDVLIADAMGKTMKAKSIFSMAIEFIKNHFLEMIKGRGFKTSASDVMWVLTVPAIWEESAKQFMREAAVMAGIPSEHLKLVLEPEAASVLCKMLPLQRNDDGPSPNFGPFNEGTRYIVLDLGGGTVDVTVHEVQHNGKLKEIIKASGGAWGGTVVGAAYERLLDQMFGPTLMREFKQTEKIEDLEMQRNFEQRKREIKNDMKEVKITVPASLLEFVEEKSGQTAKTCLKKAMGEDVSLMRNHLKIKGHVMKSMFEDSIQGIIGHVRQILNDPKVGRVDKILMVGGFSECSLVAMAVKEAFVDIQVVAPPEAGLAALKGAVIFGHSPLEIASRVVHHTYGVAVRTMFLEGDHPLENREECEEIIYCRGDAFDKLFSLGDEVGNDEIVVREYQVINRHHPMEIALYASDNPDPIVVTEHSCTKIGSIDIKHLIGGLGQNSTLQLEFGLGASELTLKITELRTLIEYEATFDFLSGN